MIVQGLKESMGQEPAAKYEDDVNLVKEIVKNNGIS